MNSIQNSVKIPTARQNFLENGLFGQVFKRSADIHNRWWPRCLSLNRGKAMGALAIDDPI
jgi:hypothetical protein